MFVPIAPIAGYAMRYGTVALAAYVLSREVETARRDQRAEDGHDDLTEGLAVRRDPGQANANWRFRRVFRLGENGPGIEIDASALARIKIRKV